MGAAAAFIVMGITLISPDANSDAESRIDAEIQHVVDEFVAIKDLPITQDEIGTYFPFNAEDEVCSNVCGFWSEDRKDFTSSHRVKIKHLSDKYFIIEPDTENWKPIWALRERFITEANKIIK